MKTYLLAAILAVCTTMPALADDTATPSPKPSASSSQMMSGDHMSSNHMSSNHMSGHMAASPKPSPSHMMSSDHMSGHMAASPKPSPSAKPRF